MNHRLDLNKMENTSPCFAYASFGYRYEGTFKIFLWLPKVEMPALKNWKGESKMMSMMSVCALILLRRLLFLKRSIICLLNYNDQVYDSMV